MAISFYSVPEPYAFIEADYPSSGWEAFHRLADRAMPALRDAIAKALDSLVNSADLTALTKAVRDGSAQAAIAAFSLGPFEMTLSTLIGGRLRELLHKAGDEASRQLEANPDVEPSLVPRFDMTNPEALSWIDQHAAQLVREITMEQQQRITDLVHEAFTRDDIPPSKIARQICDEIGLTQGQQQYMRNYRVRLEQMVAKGDAKLKPAQIDKMVGQYQQNWIKYRATTIARTETIGASAEGQAQLWNQAIAGGYLEAADMEQVWIVTPDDKTCEVCRPLAGLRAPLGQPFAGGLTRPPVHPRCRCAVGLWKVDRPFKHPPLPPMVPQNNVYHLQPNVPKSALVGGK